MSPWRQKLMKLIYRPMGCHRPVRYRRVLDIHPLFLTLVVSLAVAVSVIALLEIKLRPVVSEIAVAQAQNTMTAAVEGAVTADLVARGISYNDFVTIQRNEQGLITALTSNMAQMNLLRTELTSVILEALSDVNVSEIQVPLGSLFDLGPLWAKGPVLRARSMTVGTVRTEFDSQFTAAGVNQTLHRIWMEVTVPMTLLLPGGEVETCLCTRLCVAETVIVGQVPDTYLQLSR